MASIEAYGVWAGKITSLSRFRHIRSEYHLEFGESTVDDKCLQLRFLIRCINQDSAGTFDLGSNTDFYEGYISTYCCLCCFYQYKKQKAEQFRIDFFVLENRKYYCDWHIILYYGNIV